MCYSFTPVKTPEGVIWLPKKVFDHFRDEGRISFDPGIFPGDRPYVYTWMDGEIQEREMRFDLVPRFYLKKESPPLAEMLKRKASRKKGGDGFDSYNARFESLLERASYRTPWAESKRMVVPVSAYRERPNEEDAPAEFRGREYVIHLAASKNLAGIHDRWVNRQGEMLDSFSIITVSSAGNPLIESIYHRRCPLILDHAQVEEWLDPKTTPERALGMIRLYPADEMTLEEITRPKVPKTPEQTNLFE